MSDCKICLDPIAHPTAIECFDCAMLSPERKAAAYAIARLPEYYENRTPAWQSQGLIDRIRKMGFELTPRQQPTPQAPPAGYYTDSYGRTLPVFRELLRNGGDRISFGLALRDPEERARLEAALLRAYPIDD